MHHFTQLGCTDNLELKEEDTIKPADLTFSIAKLRNLHVLDS